MTTALLTKPTPLAKTSGFPKRGWQYLGCDDLIIANNLCEYCGEDHVRYVHILGHPDWPQSIETGCVFAANLGLAEDAGKEERDTRNRASRLKRFIDSGWRVDRPGGYIKNYKCNRVLVRPFSWGYIYQINCRDFSDTVESLQLAKIGAFEALQKIEN